MNIDQNIALHSLEESRPFDFPWLEHHILIRQDGRLFPLLHLLHRIERVQEHPIRK
jgi:hypothetical protein